MPNRGADFIEAEASRRILEGTLPVEGVVLNLIQNWSYMQVLHMHEEKLNEKARSTLDVSSIFVYLVSNCLAEM
ncbi:hypothetical protein KIN20_001461 [Parelaphostrongylus tenuis]|uniref:Uncharacterized protein n=1 Tax=Parelaphostrongylus tenuis TaxID=148309 RepID=A0AAD5LU37_PARTN|nr:hypothetical protein KIN20_001461 [Parelaphostrongylus tenuis]